MKSLVQLLALLLLPSLLLADVTEEDIIKILGTDFYGEAAQSFIEKIGGQPTLPEHTEFSYHLYEQGISLRITAGKWIQGVRIYNKTLLFTAAQGALPYGINFAQKNAFSSIVKSIGRPPLVTDNKRGQLFIFSNKETTTDFLIELAGDGQGGLMSIAWLLPENKMEKVIVSNTPLLEGLENNQVILELLGAERESPAFNKIMKHPALKDRQEVETDYKYFRDEIGLWAEMFLEKKDNKSIRGVDEIYFFRRKSKRAQASFPAALPTGLFWWSAPEEFAAKGFERKESVAAVGNHTLTKKNDQVAVEVQFKQNLLVKIKYKRVKK